MRLCVLGWPAVVDTEGVTELRGPRQVELLSLLAAAGGEVVRTEQIEDELWDGRPVSASTVRVNVTRLRGWLNGQLGHDPIRSTPLGYALELDGDRMNSILYAGRARAAAESRSRGRFEVALRQADAADLLWRGRAFEGAVDLPSVRAEHERLEALRIDTWQERAISLIELGDFARALDQIEAMQKVQPYRESAYGLQLIALHRADRRPEALHRYRRTIEHFQQELGIGPGAALLDLSTEIIADAPGDPIGESYLRQMATPGDPGAVRRGLPSGLERGVEVGPSTPFVGRDDVLARLVATLADPAAPSGSIAVVEGVGGIGKSRLAAEVARRAADRGTVVLYADCGRSVVGSAPVPDLLVGALDELTSDERPDYATPLGALLPGLDLLQAPAVEPEVDAETRRLQMLSAAERLLARVTEGPALVVIDDVQWVEPTGLRFLRHLVERLPAVRWLFLTRPGQRTESAVSLLGLLGRRYADWHELEPLTPSDLDRLVVAAAPPGRSEVWQEVVVPRAGGSPFVATALIRHLAAGGDPARLPRGVEHVVLADIARLSREAQVLSELLAVAGGPVAGEVLGDAAAIAPGRVAAARREMEASGLAERRPAVDGRDGLGCALAHDLIGEALLAHIDPDRCEAQHAALGRAMLGRDGSDVEAFRHLLGGGEQVTTEELDQVAAGALRVLNLQTSFEAVRQMGEDYLVRAGDTASTVGGLDARVQFATGLLATGETSRGLAVHDAVLPHVQESRDARLLADLVLARGPVDTGGADPLARAAEARLLLDMLPAEERSRRVQLACWAAHNLLVAGASVEARELIASARAEVADEHGPAQEAAGPVLRGIVAGVTYQAATSVDAGPEDADEAYATLGALVDETALLSTLATHRLFALDQAMRNGGLASLRHAVDELAEVVVEFPRPDLRWWVVAAEAAYALAAGDLRAADRELIRAMTLGSELSVAPSGPVSLLQRLVVQWESGQLGILHPMMGLPLRPEATPVELCMSALVCLEADDLEGARRAGRQLIEHQQMLVDAGPAWPAIATIGARTAFATDLPDLAALLADQLGDHAGCGLSFTGLVHFGSCDRLLGLLRATMGDLDAGIDLVEAAHADLARRDLPTWTARAADDAAALRRRRAAPGDQDVAARYEGLAREARRTLTLPGT